ncbi:DUF433 domain-containing protein [Parafilimonas sp.]|uniref:DUF433 domain-containing protein n=1 Tax=Parafilimonas sp. TaxID=1969739 RepID=UPI0039E726BA
MNILLHSETEKPKLNEAGLPFWKLVNMVNNGATEEEILKQYPLLSKAEIKVAVKYAGSTAVSTN